jgi:uncharacterized protein (TIGR04255 family)
MSEKAKVGERYKNPPVVEALCEIYFHDSKWDGTLPGLFFEKVRKNYPKKKELEQVGVQVSVSKEAQATQVQREERRIQFIKEDDSRLIQIENNLLVINQLRPYPRFEDWKPVVDEMLKHYSEVAQPKGIRQMGMRYINRIIIPAAKFKMEDYFNLYPQVPESLGAMHGKFMMRLEIPPKHKGHRLMVTFGTSPPESPETSAEMLDIYNIFVLPVAFPIEDVDKYIIEAHENIEAAFENSITNKTRELFEKEAT